MVSTTLTGASTRYPTLQVFLNNRLMTHYTYLPKVFFMKTTTNIVKLGTNKINGPNVYPFIKHLFNKHYTVKHCVPKTPLTRYGGATGLQDFRTGVSYVNNFNQSLPILNTHTHAFLNWRFIV